MPNIFLRDILLGAREESSRMRHYYIGIEHLFIAMLSISGSVTADILEEQGYSAQYVIDAIRLRSGKGSKHRLWTGTPNTPRTEKILQIAEGYAARHHTEINEQDVLLALFEEQDNLPVRVLRALKLDLEILADAALNYNGTGETQRPFVRVEYSLEFDQSSPLTRSQLFVLRRMFYGYTEIRVERRLTGGYTEALLLVVTPIDHDNRREASVVVKIDKAAVILDEAQRYESHVKNTLPPLTARLEDKPTAPDGSELAGIKYTLVAGADQIPKDLRVMVQAWSPGQLGEWITHMLYPTFAELWWQQNRPYRFPVWREYDWLLPPILTLEKIDPPSQPSPDHFTLRFPVRRAQLMQVEYGDVVTVENFSVQKIDPEHNTIVLAVGAGTAPERGYKVEVRNVDLTKHTHYRGEVIEQFTGRVYDTREEQLFRAVRELTPDFDLQEPLIPVSFDQTRKVPNPIMMHSQVLDRMVNGLMSKIHGDMHLGNVMVGPHDSAFLIDFARTRDGHTLFDWASLEISLLSDVVMPAAGESWDAARHVLDLLTLLNATHTLPDADSRLARALVPVMDVRRIVQRCLASPQNWGEYFVGLAMCALRAVTWQTMTIPGRRLMFLVAGQSMVEFREYNEAVTGDGDTPSPDKTDINTGAY